MTAKEAVQAVSLEGGAIEYVDHLDVAFLRAGRLTQQSYVPVGVDMGTPCTAETGAAVHRAGSVVPVERSFRDVGAAASETGDLVMCQGAARAAAVGARPRENLVADQGAPAPAVVDQYDLHGLPFQ